jgi:hypothetical protein
LELLLLLLRCTGLLLLSSHLEVQVKMVILIPTGRLLSSCFSVLCTVVRRRASMFNLLLVSLLPDAVFVPQNACVFLAVVVIFCCYD